MQHKLLAQAEIKFPGVDPAALSSTPPHSFSHSTTLHRDFFAWHGAISAIFDDFVALMKAADSRRGARQTPHLSTLFFMGFSWLFQWHLLCELLESLRSREKLS